MTSTTSLGANQPKIQKQQNEKPAETTGTVAENKPSPLFSPAPAETTGTIASAASGSSDSSSGGSVSFSA